MLLVLLALVALVLIALSLVPRLAVLLPVGALVLTLDFLLTLPALRR